MKKLLILAAGLALVSANALAQGNPVAGKQKATMCAACHGATGNSATPMFPKLAGQIPQYLVKQLEDFKSGKRTNAIMNGMAAPLSQQDMEDIAAYFSSQKTAPGTVTDAKLLAAGEQLYRGGDADTGVPACMACHGPTGAGIPIRFPRVAGQWPAYTEAQLIAFKNGTRTNDGGTMSVITARMSDAQIKAVAQYMASLQH